MQAARPPLHEDDYIQTEPRPRCRSASSASSGRSSSSRSSLEHFKSHGSSASPKPGHKKSGSFSRFFGTKEPSLDSFKQLKEMQDKELEKKGQKLPFGVPAARIPDSAKEDYKKAKQRAKERAKMHEVVKEKMRDREVERPATGRSAGALSDPLFQDESAKRSTTTTSSSRSPLSPPPASNSNRTTPRLRKPPSLDELPEMDGVVPPPAQSYPSPPASRHTSRVQSPRAPAVGLGVLSGNARKEALPWE